MNVPENVLHRALVDFAALPPILLSCKRKIPCDLRLLNVFYRKAAFIEVLEKLARVKAKLTNVNFGESSLEQMRFVTL